MPGLERLSYFELHAAVLDRAAEGEAEFALRLEPDGIELVAGIAEIAEHAQKIFPDEMRQHEAIVQRRSPAHERAFLRLAPEPRQKRAHKELLRKTHARIRRHFERAELDKAETAGRTVGRIKFVDADFRAMRVAGDVNEQVAEEAIDEPEGRCAAVAWLRHISERDFQFVQTFVPRLVHARRLTRRADEQAGKQIGERRVALPIQHDALQKIGPAQKRRVRRRRAADDNMIAAACAGVTAIDHEFVGAEPRLARLLVNAARDLDAIAPRRSGMDVDFDHTGIGRYLDDVEPRIVWRRITFDVDRRVVLACGGFDRAE